MDNVYIKKFDRIAIYAVAYSLLFLLLAYLMPYIRPFVLGAIIALISQPVSRFMMKRFKLGRKVSGAISAFLIWLIGIGLIVSAIAVIVNEIINMASMMSGIIDYVNSELPKLIDKLTSYYNSLDPSLVSTLKSSLSTLFSGSMSLAKSMMNYLLNFAKSLPGTIMTIVFSLLSGIYLSIDMPKIKKAFLSLFSKSRGMKVKDIVFESNRTLGRYFLSYFVIYAMTFMETYIGSKILGIKYAAVLSLTTTVSDLLPILGPGTVLVPTGIIYLLGGRYARGIGVVILYLAITAIRQVVEPKIVSSNIGVHPLAIIMAIFIGIKAHGFSGMIFTVFFVIFYCVLHKVGVLR